MGCGYWECDGLDQDGECKETQGECLEDMCERFRECRSCRKRSTEDCPHY